MVALARLVTTRELRAGLADTLGAVTYGRDRIGITRNGKLAAVLIDPVDYATFEALENADDIRAFDAAKAEDDGVRISATELFAELGL